MQLDLGLSESIHFLRFMRLCVYLYVHDLIGPSALVFTYVRTLARGRLPKLGAFILVRNVDYDMPINQS